MSEKPTLETLVKLYGVPDPSTVGQLPRITCSDCSNAQGKCCSKHAKSKCDKATQPRRTDGWCGNYITDRHMHISYVGHAELTRILLEIDPTWTWEPMGRNPDGSPMVREVGKEVSLWGSLTLLGQTRHGVGTCEKGKHDQDKELIGDLLRNAAMRFGISLSLWSKQEWDDAVDTTPEPTSPPQDRIATTRERPANESGTPVEPRQVLSEEEKAAAAALVDPETNPGNALIAKYNSAPKALKKARDLFAATATGEDPAPTSFPDLVDNFPALVKLLLEM